MTKLFFNNITSKQNRGISKGIFSVCSANPYVLKASIEFAKKKSCKLLVESTCNQVNQFGGYTGRNPKEFKEYLYNLANKNKYSSDNIILGGDHLGPTPWKNEKKEIALKNARELIKEYVLAGYTKIHIDTSIPLENEVEKNKFTSKLIAQRGAELCKIAEEAYNQLLDKNPQAEKPVYVIGTEVPTPGGSSTEQSRVTTSNDLVETINFTKSAFIENGLRETWDDVIAIVVEPGIKFDNYSIKEYNSEDFMNLPSILQDNENMVFEGHSTDYQNLSSLKNMVKDRIAILKVGPALTFSAREAMFSLAKIEKELLEYNNNYNLSNFIDILDMKMIEDKSNWEEHYNGKEKEVKLYRKYSYFDRSRYYYTQKEVRESLELLIDNLKSIDIPLPLLSQYLPKQYNKICKGLIKNDPESLIIGKIKDVLEKYYTAVNI